MGRFGRLVKWGLKVGVSGGVVYMAYQEGFFGSAEQTQKAYVNMKSDISNNEYVKMIPSVEMPTEIGDQVQKLSDFRGGFRHYWNCGVLYTFEKLDRLPGTVQSFAHQGLEMIENLNKPSEESQPQPENSKD